MSIGLLVIAISLVIWFMPDDSGGRILAIAGLFIGSWSVIIGIYDLIHNKRSYRRTVEE